MADGVAAVLPNLEGEGTDPREAAAGPVGAQLDADGWRLDPTDFPGCEAVRIPREKIEDHEGRVEYWDSRTETAMVVCETTLFHERPSQRLARLAERIAASSGSLIETFGTTDLVRFFASGKMRVLMQADQIVYVNPAGRGRTEPESRRRWRRPAGCRPGSRPLHRCPARQVAALRGMGLPGGLGRRARRARGKPTQVTQIGAHDPPSRERPVREHTVQSRLPRLDGGGESTALSTSTCPATRR